MVKFDYDGEKKRYNVKVPFTLEEFSSEITVASISEYNKITLHRELSTKVLQQILLKWDEKVHMDTMKAEREKIELDELINGETKTDKK